MKRTINNYDFRNAFLNSQYENKYSFEALDALFNYYEELEHDIGQEIEFDIVAIACDWVEEPL